MDMAQQHLNDHHYFNASYLLIHYMIYIDIYIYTYIYTCVFHSVGLRIVPIFELVWPHWQFWAADVVGRVVGGRVLSNTTFVMMFTLLLMYCSDRVLCVFFGDYKSFPNRLCIET